MTTNYFYNLYSKKMELLILIFVPLIIACAISLHLSLFLILKILIICGCAWILAIKPYFALRTIMAFLPILWGFGENPIIEIGSLSINIPMLVGTVVFGRYGYLLFSIDHNERSTNSIRLPCLIYLLFGLPTLLFSNDFISGLGVYLRIYSPFVILFAFFHYSNSEKQILFNIENLSFAFFAVIGSYLVGLLNGDTITTFGGLERIRASYVPATTWGKFLSVMIGVLIFRDVFNDNLKSKRFILIKLIVILVALFFTYNRTGWVGGLIIIFFSALMQRGKSKSKILLILIIAGVLINYQTFLDLFLRYTNNYSQYADVDLILSGRNSINFYNIDFFIHQAPLINKLFGIGYYNSAFISQQYYGSSAIIHNDFLAVLIEQGIISFIAYLLFIINLLILLLRDLRLNWNFTSRNIIVVTISMVIMMITTGLVGCFYGRVLNTWFLYGLLGIYLGYRNLLIRQG